MAVPLKSYPYTSASTLLTLEKEERVTVLTSSRYWYRVRTPKGEEGWIYYMFLEALQ
jgi:SH3-like domain-containing protein